MSLTVVRIDMSIVKRLFILSLDGTNMAIFKSHLRVYKLDHQTDKSDHY